MKRLIGFLFLASQGAAACGGAVSDDPSPAEAMGGPGPALVTQSFPPLQRRSLPPIGSSRPMISWVQSDGPHVAYADSNGNIYQLWYTVNTGQWAAQSLMTVPNTVPLGPDKPMTSWVQSDGPHVAYADSNGNIYQLWYTVNTGRWAAQSLMSVSLQ